MNILLFCRTNSAPGMNFTRQITEAMADQELTVCNTLAQLQGLLHSRGSLPDIIVLFIGSEGDLESLLSIHQLFENLYVILLLPGSDPGTIAKGHRLKPRFISYTDSDFDEVASVLGQLSDKFAQETQEEEI